MLKEMKAILEFIQEHETRINSICCRTIFACIVFALASCFLGNLAEVSGLLFKIPIGTAVFVGAAAGILAIFTGDFKQ